MATTVELISVLRLAGKERSLARLEALVNSGTITVEQARRTYRAAFGGSLMVVRPTTPKKRPTIPGTFQACLAALLLSCLTLTACEPLPTDETTTVVEQAPEATPPVGTVEHIDPATLPPCDEPNECPEGFHLQQGPNRCEWGCVDNVLR
jgi:hypothetical protein